MDKLDFSLSDQDNEDIFRNDIVPKYFPKGINSEKHSPKKAFYLAGQPGSGKTTVRKEIQKQYENTNDVIVLNTDDLREHHPDYRKLQADPILFKNAPVLVNHDATIWFQKLVRESVRQEKDLIFDTTLGSNDISSFKHNMGQIEGVGYKLELHILSVPEQVSKLGIHLRYEEQKDKKGSGRFVKMETHDLNYNMLPLNVKSVMDEKDFQRVAVYKKKIVQLEDGLVVNNRVELVFDSKIDGFNTNKVIERLEEGRQLELNELEKEYFVKRIKQVEAYKSTNNTLSEFRNDTEKLIKHVGLEIKKNKGLSM
jgi:predicted ABC-type ATPase